MKNITVTGGNLYQVALQYLNDATQFIRIAQLNSTGAQPMDPFMTGIVTLKIPSVNPQATGGVLAS